MDIYARCQHSEYRRGENICRSGGEGYTVKKGYILNIQEKLPDPVHENEHGKKLMRLPLKTSGGLEFLTICFAAYEISKCNRYNQPREQTMRTFHQ